MLPQPSRRRQLFQRVPRPGQIRLQFAVANRPAQDQFLQESRQGRVRENKGGGSAATRRGRRSGSAAATACVDYSPILEKRSRIEREAVARAVNYDYQPVAGSDSEAEYRE